MCNQPGRFPSTDPANHSNRYWSSLGLLLGGVSGVYYRETSDDETVYQDWALSHRGRRIDVCPAPSSIRTRNGFSLLYRAGIAGINKTIAIASITHEDDLTYALYRLNTWVLAEMWFIIIFGSMESRLGLHPSLSGSGVWPTRRCYDYQWETNHGDEEDDCWVGKV